MKKFVDSIKRKYRERLLQREQQWPPVSVEKLVNLQLVEAERRKGFRAGLPQHGAPNDNVKRTPILHGDLFKVEEGKKPVRKLIVEGNAGIGKTTLCTMLTEEWANGEILTQFDCVLLLPLRERSVSTATTLPQLFKLLHSSERIRTSVIEELEEREGEGVLIIADGWDELDDKNRCDSSFFHNLLFNDILPFVSVLLTSRPFASALLHDLPTVDRLVEVVGFNEENIKQFIASDFEKSPEKASSLIEQLENNPLIASVCSVPLNCAIICNVWQTLDRTLHSTLTELYSQIVRNIILHNLKKQNVFSSIITLSFDSIPKDLCDMFWLTCKFAYECLLQNKIVFSEEEIAPLFPQVLDSSDKLLCFGLMQCARTLLPVGQALSFHFVHLTIQEFLAALHLVTLPNEEKLKICAAHAVSIRFAMVWRFVFGLGCQKEGSYSRKVISLDDEVVDRFLSIFHDNNDGVQKRGLKLMLCHCAVESMNDVVGSKIGKQINGKFGYIISIAATPYDCVAVFNVLSHILHCADVTINLSHCGLTDKLLKELADILSNADGELQVRKLTMKGNMITDSGVTDLLKRASASLSFLKSLDLCNNNIKASFSSLESLYLKSCNDMPISSLTDLVLSDNPLGVSGIQSFETAVQAGALVNLKYLYLSNTLTDDADINVALLATLSPSIASHCPHLIWLDLSRNNLGITRASALGGLFSSRSKFILVLNDSNINAEAVAAFSVANIDLKPSFGSALDLSDCTLNLSNNPLGYDGLLAIFRMLRSETCPITTLYLNNTDLTIPVNMKTQYHGKQATNTSNILCLGPVFNSSRIKLLSLAYNNLSGNNALIIAECVRVCKSLELLLCKRCSISSSEVINILDHLKNSNTSHKNLRVWDLNYNSIDNEGVNALIESLSELFPGVEDVYLIGNPVSGEVKEGLDNILKVSI